MKLLIPESQSKGIRVGIVLMLGAFWLCLERYHGFYHDALLYLMLALYKLQPANYQNDLFVAFGSQGKFTVFSFVYGYAIKWAGVDYAAFGLTVIAQLLWFCGVILLVRRFASGWQAVAGLACITYFSRFYDPNFIFSYSEPFPTPRPFAEAFSMIAISFGLGRRYLPALVMHGIAVSFHPLISAYALGVSCVRFLCDKEISRRLRMALLLGAVCIFSGLLITRVSIFGRFWHVYDPAWYAMISAFMTDTLVQEWNLDSACRVLYFLVVLWMVWWRKIPMFRKHVPVLTGVSAALLICWLVGSGLFWNQLITQLQPWRCIWLLQIFALLAQGVLLTDLWRGEPGDRWLAAFILAAILKAGYVNEDGIYALGFVLAGLVVRALINQVPAARHLASRAWSWLPLVVPLPQFLVNGLKMWAHRGPSVVAVDRATWLPVTGTAVCVLILFLIVRIAWGKRHNWLQGLGGAAVGLGCVAIGCAVCVWSLPFTTASVALNKDDQAMTAALQARIPDTAVVYSNYGLHWTWYLLRRSNYADIEQMSGLVFSRESSIEGHRRLKHLCDAGLPGCQVAGYGRPQGPIDGAFWAAHARRACADPVLDFLVLDGEVPKAEVIRYGKRVISVLACVRYR